MQEGCSLQIKHKLFLYIYIAYDHGYLCLPMAVRRYSRWTAIMGKNGSHWDCRCNCCLNHQAGVSRGTQSFPGCLVSYPAETFCYPVFLMYGTGSAVQSRWKIYWGGPVPRIACNGVGPRCCPQHAGIRGFCLIYQYRGNRRSIQDKHRKRNWYAGCSH